MDLVFSWNPEKNAALRQRHGIGFEDVVIAFQENGLLADMEHPNRDRYEHQRLAVVLIENYAFAVPYVMDGETRFLKTLFPSRKLHKQYVGEPHVDDH